MSKINKVLYNVDQRDSTKGDVNTREERWMSRHNIGLDEVVGKATVTESGKVYTGIAPLGTNGLVPAEYLPSYVDAVVEGYYFNKEFYYDASHTQKITPDVNTTYVDITDPDVGISYRYTNGDQGSETGYYFQISNQNAFGRINAGDSYVTADHPMDTLRVAGDSWIGVSIEDVEHLDTLYIKHASYVGSGYIGSAEDTSGRNTLTIPWAGYDDQGHIVSVGSRTHTIQNATTSDVGVVQLTSDYGDDETKAVTQKGVKTAIGQLDYGNKLAAGKFISSLSQTDGMIDYDVSNMDTTPTTDSTNPVTSGGVKAAIDALDCNDALSAGTFITSLSQTDGKIAYSVANMDTTPTSGSSYPVTSGGVNSAIRALSADETYTGTNFSVTVSETHGVIVAVTGTDNTANKTHAHGSISSDGKVISAATSLKSLLVTDADNYVKMGLAFGTDTGDERLFLNKNGSWVNLPEATDSAYGSIKIGYTQTGKNYPLVLDSDGKAYVNVPWVETTYTAGTNIDITNDVIGTTADLVGETIDLEKGSTGAELKVGYNTSSTAYTRLTPDYVYLNNGSANCLTLHHTNGLTFQLPAGNKGRIRNNFIGITDSSNNTIAGMTNTDITLVNDGTTYSIKDAKTNCYTKSETDSLLSNKQDAVPTFAKYTFASNSAGKMYVNTDVVPKEEISSYLCGYVSSITLTEGIAARTLLWVPPQHRGTVHFIISSIVTGGTNTMVNIYLTDVLDTIPSGTTVWGSTSLGHEYLWESTSSPYLEHSFIVMNDSDTTKYITAQLNGQPGAAFNFFKEFEMFPLT